MPLLRLDPAGTDIKSCGCVTLRLVGKHEFFPLIPDNVQQRWKNYFITRMKSVNVITVIRPAGGPCAIQICSIDADTGGVLFSTDRSVRSPKEEDKAIRTHLSHVKALPGFASATLIVENNIGFAAEHIADMMGTADPTIRIHSEDPERVGVHRKSGDPLNIHEYAQSWRGRV